MTSMDKEWALRHGFKIRKLKKPVTITFANGAQEVSDECIGAYMEVGGRKMEYIEFLSSNLHGHAIFLGHDWLVRHNPYINWRSKVISFHNCDKGAECTNSGMSAGVEPIENQWLREFPSVFQESTFNHLPAHWGGADYVITLIDGVKPCLSYESKES